VEAHYNLGNAYNQLGRPSEAMVEYRRAIEIDPGMTDAYYNLAHIHQLQNQKQTALKLYEKIIEIDPSHHHTYINLGVLYFENRENEKSVRSFQKALEFDPLNLTAHFNLGMIHYQNKNYSDSVHHLDRAIQEGARVPPQIMKELKPYRKEVPFLCRSAGRGHHRSAPVAGGVLDPRLAPAVTRQAGADLLGLGGAPRLTGELLGARRGVDGVGEAARGRVSGRQGVEVRGARPLGLAQQALHDADRFLRVAHTRVG